MAKLFKVATPHPFPERLALEFLDGLDEVLCIEELDPVIERELTWQEVIKLLTKSWTLTSTLTRGR